MASYDITAPDGRKFRINAPEGATREQALEFAKSQLSAQNPAQNAQPVQAEINGQPEQVNAEETPSEQGFVKNSIGAVQSYLTGLTDGQAAPLTGALAGPLTFMAQDVASSLPDAMKRQLGLENVPRPNARQILNQTQQIAYDAYAPQRQFAEEHPVADVVLQVAGGLIGAKGLGSTAAGQRIAGAARTAVSGGNIATRTVARAGLGAASGATYAAGTAKPGERGEAALDGAGMGAAVATAIPAIGSAALGTYGLARNVSAGLRSATPEAMTSTAQIMRERASGLYSRAREIGATLAPASSRFLSDKVARAVHSVGMTNPRLHGDTLSVLSQFREVPKRGGFYDLQELDQYRQLFSDVINKNTVNGRANADAMLATRAISAIDDAVDGIDDSMLLRGSREAIDALKQGRAAWGQARSYERLSDAVSGAAGDPNRIKAAMFRFAQNRNNLRGFTEAEVAAIKEAGSSSGAEKVMRLLGTFGFDIGNTLTGKNAALPGLMTGLGYVNPAMVIPVAAGTAARSVAKQSARGAAQRALDAVANRGQLTRAMTANPTLPGQLNNPALLSIASQQSVPQRWSQIFNQGLAQARRQ